jgi:hypothetical protein
MNADDADPIDLAHAYASRGWRVLPIRPGEKRPPMGAWQKAATTDPEMIDKWWNELYREHGVGVATGSSSGIFVLDVDVADDKAGDETLAELEAKYGGLPDTPTVLTPSGGVHYYFAIPQGMQIRNDAGRRLGVGLDIRGEGGQVVAPPTVRGIDAYDWMPGTWELEPAQAPRWLIERIAELPKPKLADLPVAPKRIVEDDDGPAQRFNQRTTWAQLLEADGWTLASRQDDGEEGWTRPGKDPKDGISATVGHEGHDVLTVFTSSIEWLPEGSYSRFGYLACRDHAGDRSGAARALRDEDYAGVEAVLAAVPIVAPESHTSAAQEDDEVFGTGWDPLDLTEVLSDGYTPPMPEILKRDDDAALLYPGRINALYGESGSGKSWVAMFACAQLMLAGEHVLYIDLEDHVGSVLTRLKNLGVSTSVLQVQFHYVSPVLAWNDQAERKITATIVDHDCKLAVIDSTGEAMALDGADPNSDDDVARWFRRVPRTMARLGPAVLLLDHVPKAKDAPGGFAIGSQRKRAAIDGASYRVNSSVAPAKGVRGILKLITAKDRGGHYQQGHEVAQVVIEDDVLDGVKITMSEPVMVVKASLPSQIKELLAQHPEGLSKNSISEELGCHHKTSNPIVDDLTNQGVLEQIGRGNKTRFVLTDTAAA